ncbi:MAG TPA: LysR family transcriptional regulator [Anaerolineales bacterium]|nr:LysR family transcriptional regulator [Anaerolineales bacterium]
MNIHYNFWLEENGRVVLSPWRAKLLQAIAETGSISAAARQMDVSYRRAWEKLKEMEDGFGQSLLTTEIGGAHGGGASLTPYAQSILEKFNRLITVLDREIQANFIKSDWTA